MKQINYKKLILPNIPYVFFVYLFDKVGQAVRLAPGADISAKILNITQGFSAAFENALKTPCRAFTRWICLSALSVR